MKNRRKKRTYLTYAAVCLILLITAVSGSFISQKAETILSGNVEVSPTPRRRKAAAPVNPKYFDFTHATHSGKLKQDCASCHKFPSSNWEKVRKTDAFPDITDYPKHESCLNCHREQFFKGSSPAICSNCHLNPSPNDSSRHPFPNPREIYDQSPKGKTAVSDFQVSFPHDKHIEIVSEYRPARTPDGAFFANARMNRATGEESCKVCHQTYKPQGDSDVEYFTKPPEKSGDAFWLKKGTFKTAPIGHATCFTCHSTDTGILPAPTDCGVCHKLAPEGTIKADFDAKLAAVMNIDDKIMLDAWRRRDSSGTFRHEFSSHADMECAACHNAAAMNTLDALTKKVAVTSCNMCHITATTDDGGILNYEIDARKKNAKFECVKCHVVFGKMPVPESHFKAVEAAK